MTLDQLERIAHISRLGDTDTVGLRDAVLAYVSEVHKAERGATPKQQEVLALWEKHRSEHGRYPSMREAAAALGVSKVTVFGHGQELCRKGLMRRRGKHLSRCLELVR